MPEQELNLVELTGGQMTQARTCAPAYVMKPAVEQIQFLLGHISVQTTEQYLGCKQRFRSAVNHHIGIEPDEE